MAPGWSIEDELLTAAVGLQRGPGGEWEAGELLVAFEAAVGADVDPFTVHRHLRRFVRNGWIAERTGAPDGPGRPRPLYRLRPEGVARAQQVSQRRVPPAAAWVLPRLRTTSVDLALLSL